MDTKKSKRKKVKEINITSTCQRHMQDSNFMFTGLAGRAFVPVVIREVLNSQNIYKEGIF
jgi:hypothetical protein